MAALENPKHEEFALLLARGVKQGEAYMKAGYSENKGAASRLAGSPKMEDRVEELKTEMSRKITTAMSTHATEDWESLAEMGLTMEWVAAQYKEVYEGSMVAGSFASANSAIQNIQKLIEIEQNGKSGDDEGAEASVSVKDTLALLQGFKDIMSAPVEPQPEELEHMRDITPEE